MFTCPGPRVGDVDLAGVPGVGEVHMAGVPRGGDVQKVGVVYELLTDSLPLLLGMQK